MLYMAKDHSGRNCISNAPISSNTVVIVTMQTSLEALQANDGNGMKP